MPFFYMKWAAIDFQFYLQKIDAKQEEKDKNYKTKIMKKKARRIPHAW